MLTAVEGLAIAVGARERIHRLGCIVAVYASLRGGSTLQPVATEIGAVAKQRGDPPAIDRLTGIDSISALSSSERALKLKVLPDPTPMRASWARISVSFASAGAN
jgi:hypothetical protein